MNGILRRAWERICSFFRRSRLDREFDAEIAAHLDLAIDENIRGGMSPEEARRLALIRLGGLQQSKELHRRARGLPALEIGIQDLRYRLRTLRRDRSFAVVAVLMLGLGIGANVAVFSVVNEILLRPLPFKDPRQLVWIEQANGKSGLSSLTYSVDAYEGFRQRNRTLEDVTGYFPFSPPDNYRLGGHGDPLPVTAISVLGNFFQVLGVEPAIGRVFLPEETQRNGRAAVLRVSILAAAVRRRPGSRGPSHRLKRNAGHGHRRSARSIRFRRGVFAQRKGGCVRSGHSG